MDRVYINRAERCVVVQRPNNFVRSMESWCSILANLSSFIRSLLCHGTMVCSSALSYGQQSDAN